MSRLDDDQINDLLAARATQGLAHEELTDLRNFLGNHWDEDYSDFELAATAISLHGLPTEPLPTHLREQIELTAAQWFTENTPPANIPQITVTSAPPRPRTASRRATPPPRPRLPLGQRVGWWLAATACIALALTFAWPYLNRRSARTPAAQRAQMLARGGDVITWTWTPTGLPEGANVTGDVVWSPRDQRGFMRFRNLTPNNPQNFTYQLWIFDATRDERFPVDGGYFDVAANESEIIIPITAKLPVMRPALFALTIEPPGGVVVSRREKIVVTAKSL